MIRKIKIASPYLLILVLVGLLIGFNFWSSRVRAADTSSTEVDVGNAPPTVGDPTLNGGYDIVLIENVGTDITASATVTDNNGCTDIAGVYAYLYRSSITASGSPDLDNFYVVASCQEQNGIDSCGAATSAVYECVASATLMYFAEGTDEATPASNQADEWVITVVASDSAKADASNDQSDTEDVDVGVIRALEASTSIDYITISAGTNTGASPIEMGVENTGNSGMDPRIKSDTTLTCQSGGCNVGVDTIADANQKYASVSQDYSDPYNVALTGSYVQLDLTTPKPDSDTYPVDDQVFWGLAVDGGQAVGFYQGQSSFSAIGD